jgi:hypothetical protein
MMNTDKKDEEIAQVLTRLIIPNLPSRRQSPKPKNGTKRSSSPNAYIFVEFFPEF